MNERIGGGELIQRNSKAEMSLTAMSLEEKIGQMFMCGFDDTTPTEGIAHLIQKKHIGGIVYFRRNIKDVKQIIDLSRQLQQLAMSNIPLFISIDQEGGMVARIDKNISLSPGNMALGATRDVEGVYEAARMTGLELRLLGINMNFAPCLDVNNNPRNPVIGVRSYGECPHLVTLMGRAAIRGYQQANIVATAKHFPGHGDTHSDSHLDLPVIKHTLERLNDIELAPFAGAITEGVDAIMTAHVLFPEIEQNRLPATLSHRVLTGLLRQKLDYRGVIVTDCLEMKAISEHFGTEEGAVLAVEAGADLLLVSHTYDKQVAAVDAVIEAVQNGRLCEQRINESVARLLQLKKKRCIDASKHERTMWPLRNSAENTYEAFVTAYNKHIEAKTLAHLSEKSITVVKNTDNFSLKNEKTLVIWPEVREGTEVDEVIEQDETLGAILAQTLSDVDEVRIGVSPLKSEIKQITSKCHQYKQFVVVTYNATFHTGQVKIVKALAEVDRNKLAVVATRNPYDILQFPEIKTYIACYENRPLAMQSVAKILLGQKQACGKLPVSISTDFPFGHLYSTNLTRGNE